MCTKVEITLCKQNNLYCCRLSHTYIVPFVTLKMTEKTWQLISVQFKTTAVNELIFVKLTKNEQKCE